MAQEKMAQEKTAPEKMALGIYGTGKKGTIIRLGKNGTSLLAGKEKIISIVSKK